MALDTEQDFKTLAEMNVPVKRAAYSERRAEIGTHHHISGRYLHSYANEMAWREDYRREPNGTQYLMVAAAALGHPVSREWKGYWQRSAN